MTGRAAWLTTRVQNCVAFVALILGLAPQSIARAQPSRSPEDLARRVLKAFASGSGAEFDAVFPFPGGRAVVRQAIENRWPRHPGDGLVLSRKQDAALLLLGGHPRFGNSGDEVIVSWGFSGVYRALATDTGWVLAEKVPLNDLNRIDSQRLGVTVEPAKGIDVVDTLSITVLEDAGVVARLNHLAELTAITVDDAPARHSFSSGLLWIGAQPGAHRIVLAYHLPVQSDSNNTNSGNFLARSGHVRNQYFWHPFFDFSSVNDLAQFAITVRSPASIYVATSLPQRDTVVGDYRLTTAQSRAPTESLTLLYDHDWHRTSMLAAGIEFETFTTVDFTPAIDTLRREFVNTATLLSKHFGTPPSSYTAIVQGRARMSSGWLYRSNDAIVAGVNGGPVADARAAPNAYLGHEIAHMWTNPTGAASNFLREGWATFAESMILGSRYGPDVVQDFWESTNNRYFLGNFDGRMSLVDDPQNSGVAYSKGAWVLRMLRDFIGDSSFDRGMRAFVGIPRGQDAGHEEFIRAMSTAAGEDLRAFLWPWMTEKVVPDIEVRSSGTKLTVVQHGPPFRLRLPLELSTRTQTVRREFEIRDTLSQINVAGLDSIVRVRVDPDHRLLIRRRDTGHVRFLVTASNAERVIIAGDFASMPFTPVRGPNGEWTAERDLPEGRYFWCPRIDDKRRMNAMGGCIVFRVGAATNVETRSDP